MTNIRTITIPRASMRSLALSSIGAGIAAMLCAIPAFAGEGESASCSVVNPNRFQCNFSALSQRLPTEIQYASMQCGSTGSVVFSLQEFQVLTTPPNSNSEVAYQIPITNQPSLGGVVNAGSPVALYVKVGTEIRALIDLTPAPTSGTTQCTVSLSSSSALPSVP